MAWIELHQAVWTHRKTFQLADALDLDETYAAAHVIRLWTWALDNAPEGALADTPARVIARASGWTGDADIFVSALVSSGWLDQQGDTYRIHDWDDYAGRLIERRRQDAERLRRWRETHKDERRTKPVSNGVTVPNPTGPDLTLPDRSTGATARVGAREDVGPNGPPPPDANGVESAKPTTIRPVPKPKPRTDAFAICLARIRDLAPDLVIGGERERNAKAVNSAHAPPELVAEAYVALMRGDWVNGFVLKQASLHAVVDNIGGYVARKAERNGTSGSAHQPQSELGQAVAREHAEHARRLASPGSDS